MKTQIRIISLLLFTVVNITFGMEENQLVPMRSALYKALRPATTNNPYATNVLISKSIPNTTNKINSLKDRSASLPKEIQAEVADFVVGPNELKTIIKHNSVRSDFKDSFVLGRALEPVGNFLLDLVGVKAEDAFIYKDANKSVFISETNASSTPRFSFSSKTQALCNIGLGKKHDRLRLIKTTKNKETFFILTSGEKRVVIKIAFKFNPAPDANFTDVLSDVDTFALSGDDTQIAIGLYKTDTKKYCIGVCDVSDESNTIKYITLPEEIAAMQQANFVAFDGNNLAFHDKTRNNFVIFDIATQKSFVYSLNDFKIKLEAKADKKINEIGNFLNTAVCKKEFNLYSYNFLTNKLTGCLTFDSQSEKDVTIPFMINVITKQGDIGLIAGQSAQLDLIPVKITNDTVNEFIVMVGNVLYLYTCDDNNRIQLFAYCPLPYKKVNRIIVDPNTPDLQIYGYSDSDEDATHYLLKDYKTAFKQLKPVQEYIFGRHTVEQSAFLYSLYQLALLDTKTKLSPKEQIRYKQWKRLVSDWITQKEAELNLPLEFKEMVSEFLEIANPVKKAERPFSKAALILAMINRAIDLY